VAQNEQQTGAHKTMQQALIIKKQENYNTQTKQIDDALVYENFKNVRNFKTTFKQKKNLYNFSELTEVNYNVAL
jgi:hypothetical protein